MLNGSLTPVYSTLAVGGHVDEFVRFVDENTILLVEEPTDAEAASNPIIAQTKAAIQQTRQILESSTDQDGNSFTIVDLPDAHPMYAELQEGDGVFDYYTLFDYESIGYDNIDPSQTMWVYFASGYMNFLVTNNVVIIPKYGDYDPSQATKDAEAKAVLEQVFPGRQVIQLDVRAINVGGGGIHCITQQMPATAVPSN
jgi:agmatine deiminase